MNMNIGFTGTQKGMNEFQKNTLHQILKDKNCKEFSHGDCIGSDSEAMDIAIKEGVKIFSIYPPRKDNKRAWKFNEKHLITPSNYQPIDIDHEKVIHVRWLPLDDYLARNYHIVDNVELIIATPKEVLHTTRSGTWATIRYCWKIKREVIIIPPIL